MENVKRVYVEKKKGFNIEAESLLKELKNSLNITSLERVRILIRYDISGLDEKEFDTAVKYVLSDPAVDNIIYKKIPDKGNDRFFSVEYMPGQYDQRGDSAAQCIQAITLKRKPLVRTATLYLFKGDMDDSTFNKIRRYLINPVDSREASDEIPKSLILNAEKPEKIKIISGFISMTDDEIKKYKKTNGISISIEDLIFCRNYFRDKEKRDPTETEIKIIDTYWSDHCRHTTFETILESVEIEDTDLNVPLKRAYDIFSRSFKKNSGIKKKPLTLMSIATMSMKEMRAEGRLNDLEVSDEINACSIEREVIVDGHPEKWLIMFKNETHNHPTEIEPFGGAATCLGGAIRDPLSGRAYVYQGMRITGSGDPRENISDTIPGKLPQRKITLEAARGFSSYGNQIGVATGIVNEIYHNGYKAKRMEVGAVVGAVPKSYVVRETPSPGDMIILVGGRTGRDGIGGATGSSKEHDEKSVSSAGAEVQKGNAPEERKLQRLFRRQELIKLIKKSNDFGAGGVSVAVGELADGVIIDLNKIPKKYNGLDGTEIALSESQERLAVVVEKNNVNEFIKYSDEENIEATVIAQVTADKRLKMKWGEDLIVNIDRNFLDTSGVRQKTSVFVSSPEQNSNYFNRSYKVIPENFEKVKDIWIEVITGLNNASQRGLKEMFDGTIGAGTVIMPIGGMYGSTPAETMAALIPTISGRSETATVMSFGTNPEISEWSPFHGGIYCIVDAVTKIVASGGDYSNIRISLQEYFEKLGENPMKWGKPFSALLGAYYAMHMLGIAAIGGKDSMSGTFVDLNVPPTIIAFAIDTVDVSNIISPEFKKDGNEIMLIKSERDGDDIPVFNKLKDSFNKIREGIKAGSIISAHTVGEGGIALTLSKMCSGNRIGVTIREDFDASDLFTPDFGSILLEVKKGSNIDRIFNENDYRVVGKTINEKKIIVKGGSLEIDELTKKSESVLSSVFNFGFNGRKDNPYIKPFKKRNSLKPSFSLSEPRVMIPVFPGTNCEFDMAKAFEDEGAIAFTPVFRNLTSDQISESISHFKNVIENSQIIAIPGGFSAGDEPDGSGKFIAAVLRNPELSEALMNLLYKRDGLILGICNGFQALIKLGLLPYGKIIDLNEKSPTLTFNTIGRHISKIVNTKVVSVLSPWLAGSSPGDIQTVPISHGEGRFTANIELIKKLETNGQITTQYVDNSGYPTYESDFNPNGSDFSIEGISSPDGKVLGKMGHSERIGHYLYKNIPGIWDKSIFRSGVNYFK